MFRLVLLIENITPDERDVLLKKIDLIIHHTHKPLIRDLDYSSTNDEYPCWIRIDSYLSMDKALELMKLFNALDISPEKIEEDNILHPRMILYTEHVTNWVRK